MFQNVHNDSQKDIIVYRKYGSTLTERPYNVYHYLLGARFVEKTVLSLDAWLTSRLADIS